VFFTKTHIPGEVTLMLLRIDAGWYLFFSVAIIYYGTTIFVLRLYHEFVYGLVWIAFGIALASLLLVPKEAGLFLDIAQVLVSIFGALLAVVTGLDHIHKRINGRGDALERAWIRYLKFMAWRFTK